MIRGQEFHSIIQNVFGEVQGLNVSEQIQVNCPRCQEREGLFAPDGKFNLEINTARRVFRCWKCDEPRFSGSLKRLIRTYGSRIDFDLYKSYADIYGDDYVAEDYELSDDDYVLAKLPNEMILFADMDITNPSHLNAYNYMILERRFSKQIIIKYRLGFCVEGKYANRVIIPSYDKYGEINYFVARTYDKTVKNKFDNPKSDKERIIFNEGLINWDSTVYLVEGVFEMLTFPVNTIPILGKTLSTTLFLKLKELKPDVVVLLDPDAYTNAIELFYTLKTIYVDCEERVKIVKIPFEKDLDELRKNKGINEVIKSLYGARGLIVDDYFIRKLDNPYDKKWKGRYGSNSKYFEGKPLR